MFENITDISALKKFACPKVASKSEWWNDCVSCKGKCAAGYRAVVLLDQATSPDIPKKRYDPSKNPKVVAVNEARTEAAKQKFRRAFAISGDPVNNQMEQEGCSLERALANIRHWINFYPDLAEELHAVERMKSDHKRGRVNKVDQDNRIREALKTVDPIGYLVSNYHVTKYNAARAIDRWKETHPEIQNPKSEADISEEVTIDDFLKENPVLKVETVEETDDGVKAAAAPAETLEELEKKVAEQLTAQKPLMLHDVYDQLGIPIPFDPEKDGWINPETDIPPALRTTTDGTNLAEKFAQNEVLASDEQKELLGYFDNVNRPSHYTFGAIEVIDYIRDKMSPEMFQGFCMGNVLKYVSRHKHKNGVEDLKKAGVYLNWLIESEGE